MLLLEVASNLRSRRGGLQGIEGAEDIKRDGTPPGDLYRYQNKGVATKGVCIVIKTKGVHFALLGRAACHREVGGRFGRRVEETKGRGSPRGGLLASPRRGAIRANMNYYNIRVNVTLRLRSRGLGGRGRLMSAGCLFVWRGTSSNKSRPGRGRLA